LRAWLQRQVNHLLYGERDEPYAVIARLGRQLETTLAPEAVLPTIVQTVKDALKLPYVAIALIEEGERRIVAETSGRSPMTDARQHSDVRPVDLLTFPLVYQQASVGELLVAPRAANEGFSPADKRLLMLVAQQASVAAYSVRLTRDLQHLTSDLQHSREQIVMSREEERRRLRRDLHDGIGPTLASLAQRLDVARNLIERDPVAVEALLVDIKGQVKETIADIRRLVYALRPPVLDEFGLISAVREHIAQMNQSNSLHITFHVSDQLPPLPAAVEVAAYRIILEAVTNVMRHAQARTCQVSLLLIEHNARHILRVEIVDDGIGVASDQRAGVGLMSMRERVAELGGTWSITNEPPRGTRVAALLPVACG
jgi:signal transduction histidine kinase